MAAFRFIALLVAVLASPCISSANPPVWQPYRPAVRQRTLAPRATQVSIPQPVFVEAQVTDLPVDALTDADLNQLAYCGDELSTHQILADPVMEMHLANSQPRTNSLSDGIELLPSDVIWHSYWAGAKESRTSAALFEEFSDDLTLLDVSLGGRTAILRDAARNDQGLWYGWELQIEGAANLRLNLDQDWDFESADFRFGVPLILARNHFHWKFAYYHLSSHVGDEFLVRNPGYVRLNYSRDVLVVGGSFYPLPAWRWYAEAGWAFYEDEGSEPWEFQFGLDYAQPGPTGIHGTPFFALNGHLRQEVHFGGNLALQAGWLWRGATGRILRTGLHYYNGKSPQFEFYNQFEQQLGIGLWQDY